MMDKPTFIDYETRICSAFLNAVASTVWDALGQATNPQDARTFIGAVEEAPQDGESYARQNAQWVQITVGNLHNDLAGRSAADAHPVSAITGLQSALDQINIDLAGKAPSSASTATGTSFSPTGSISSANVQAALAELDGDVTANAGAITALDGSVVKRTSATGAAIIPAGNTAARPATPGDGYFRFNEQLSIFEGYTTINGWVPIGGGQITASDVSFTPGGTISANNVQLAIGELDTEKAPASAGTAAGTSFTPAGGIVATNVQAAIVEVATPKAGDILQVVTHFDGGASSSGSSWANLTAISAYIAPKSNNSRFIIECIATLYVSNVAGVNAEAVFQMYSGSPSTGNFGTAQTISAFSASGGVGVRCGGSFLAEVQNTDLAGKSYALAGSPTVGSPNQIAATQQGWKITEIQN